MGVSWHRDERHALTRMAMRNPDAVPDYREDDVPDGGSLTPFGNVLVGVVAFAILLTLGFVVPGFLRPWV